MRLFHQAVSLSRVQQLFREEGLYPWGVFQSRELRSFRESLLYRAAVSLSLEV